ncbi:MAG: FixH family protein [Woeseiaceae bacterium]|nr:FixH family protein [Woeseiaceae bacterium]
MVGENDLCIINIGYLKAHFKIFVPQETGHAEYCEDIPVRGESVFVMEYQHEGLSSAEIDFRIIRNVTGKSKFARAGDVAAIKNLDDVTVHYAAPAVVPHVYSLLYNFAEDGEYIGIVSASSGNGEAVYWAIFPFEVGYTGIGIWPWILAALILLQLNYWYMNKRRTSTVHGVALIIGLLAASGASAEGSWISDSGYFEIRYTSELDPIVINTMHRWHVDIRDAEGNAVEDAKITIRGGMPKHSHGMPTSPVVTGNAGSGRYEISGMRFHMGGYWEIRLTIITESRRDTVTISLDL